MLSFLIIGCVCLAPLGRPQCVVFIFTKTNVGNYLHTLVLGKENATHWGRPREAKRTHPVTVHAVTVDIARSLCFKCL